MAVPEITGDAGCETIRSFMRQEARGEATREAERVLGLQIGRYCQAMLGDKGEARNAAESVLHRFHSGMDQVGGGSLRLFVFQLAYEICQKRLAARDPEAPPAETEGDLDTPKGARERLSTLDEGARVAALLRYIGGLGYGPIARICAVEVREAEKLVARAVLAMRDNGAEAQ